MAASYPGSAKQFTYQDSRADASPDDLTKADAADINKIYQEIEAVEAELLDHMGAGGAEHATATTATAGFLSAADKVKLTDHPGSGGSNHDTATASTPGFLRAANKTRLDAISVYDSGWQTVAVNTAYTHTHNLDTSYPLVTIFYRADASSPVYQVWRDDGLSLASESAGPEIEITSANAILVFAKYYLIRITLVNQGPPPGNTTGQYRVVVRRFV